MGGGEMNSKQVLSIEQMQHLQELGLELDYNTILSWIVDDREKDKPLLCISSEAVDYVDFSHYCLPAYTLQDVLDELPIEIDYRKKRCWLCIDLADEWVGYYYENIHFAQKYVYYEAVKVDESIIDAVYRLLCWAIEQGYIKTGKEEEQ